MFFRRDKVDRTVLFIDASREYADGKNQNKLRDADIAKIAAAWRARKDVPKYAHLAIAEELKANDYSLNVPLYVDNFEEEEPIDLEAVKSEIAKMEAELTATRIKLATALQELGL
jgi:type I restriction enzyme M protein